MGTQAENQAAQRMVYTDTMKSFLKLHFDYMLVDILLYIVFAICIFLVAYAQLSPLSYWHHRTVSHLILEGHYSDMAIDEVSRYACLLRILMLRLHLTFSCEPCFYSKLKLCYLQCGNLLLLFKMVCPNSSSMQVFHAITVWLFFSHATPSQQLMISNRHQII